MNSVNWTVCVGKGNIGVCVWLEVPIMHRMSGLSLAWQLHGVCWHENLISQSGIVSSGIVLLSFPTLVSVKYRVFLLANNKEMKNAKNAKDEDEFAFATQHGAHSRRICKWIMHLKTTST